MTENLFGIDERILALAHEAEKECEQMFAQTDEIARFNGEKVLKAFIDNRVSESCLKGTTGYGYGDCGRDTLDKVFAQAFGGENAIVRHTFVNVNHALSNELIVVLRISNTQHSCMSRP